MLVVDFCFWQVRTNFGRPNGIRKHLPVNIHRVSHKGRMESPFDKLLISIVRTITSYVGSVIF